MESEIKILTARTNLFRKSHNEVVEASAIERSQPPPRPSQPTMQTSPLLIDDAPLAFSFHRNVEEATDMNAKSRTIKVRQNCHISCYRRHVQAPGSRRKIVWRPLSLLKEGSALPIEL